jgi:hypothetical protein
MVLKIYSPSVAIRLCYFYAVPFLGVFEKLRKATTGFIMFAYPFVYIFVKIILNEKSTYSIC